jgi:hypothetical protein
MNHFVSQLEELFTTIAGRLKSPFLEGFNHHKSMLQYFTNQRSAIRTGVKRAHN